MDGLLSTSLQVGTKVLYICIDYRNMLRAAQDWGHQVFVWHNVAWGGKVYKLRYNPAHKATLAVLPSDNWEEANQIAAPAASLISEWI